MEPFRYMNPIGRPVQMALSVAADGTLIQAKSAFEDGSKLPGFPDIFTNLEATMCWSGRSGDGPTDPSDCQLTDDAAKIAVYVVTQFYMAAHMDSQFAFQSTNLIFIYSFFVSPPTGIALR